MTGKFTPPSPIDEVRESLENLEKKYKEADEKLKKEIENKIESASSPTQETPTLSQVLAKGNEMDKDIDIADGKNFNNFNSASKEVHTTSYDTDFSRLYFAGAKTILEYSNIYNNLYSDYIKQKIELDKNGISLISNFRHFGEHGNPDSGGGEITSQLYFNFNGFLLSQENNGQKTEIIKVDSEGIKTKKISQTEYSEPTDERDYVTKKYVDEAVQNAGGGSRTVQWWDIEDRPTSVNPLHNNSNGTIEYSIDKIGSFITVDPAYFEQSILEFREKRNEFEQKDQDFQQKLQELEQKNQEFEQKKQEFEQRIEQLEQRVLQLEQRP
ncbi:hypothetical protein [Capnocytophaga sputigena]|uniref:hypothetical protein n=1 Tax=Capnocytophaga sputigena TaxID=1019 RepID=UPI0031F5A00B